MKKMKTRNRIAFLSVFLLMAALVLSTFIVSASGDEDDEKNYKATILVGAGTTDDEGLENISGLSAGRAAEYGPTDTTGFFALLFNYAKESNYFYTYNFITNTDNMLSQTVGSLGRQLIFTSDLRRFVHRLDNDTMADWAAPYTADVTGANENMQMTATMYNAKAKFKPTFMPSHTLYLHLKLINRDGTRQARTLDHCTSCHVTAKSQELDQQTLAVAFGVKYAKKPFAAKYEHKYRSFEDSSQSLTYNYANRFGNFDLEGVNAYASTPGNTLNKDVGAARLDLGNMFSVIGKARRLEVENDDTGYTLETNSFAGRVSIHPTKWFRLLGRFDYFDTTNDAPMTASREITRFSGSAIVRPVKELKLEGRYNYEKVERTGSTSVEESTTESIRIKGIWRPNRQIRISASHQFVDREDPFGHVLRNTFSVIDNVLLSPYGTNEDVTRVNATYNMDKLNLNASYYRRYADENDQDVEMTIQNFSVGGNFMASDMVSFMGNYTYFSNEYERDIYLGVLAPFLTVTPLPYEGTGNTISLSAWLRTDWFSLRPGWDYTTVESFFSGGALGSSLGTINEIDATINRLSLEIGVPVTDSVNINFGYWLDDYEDAAQPQDDGQVHWLYGWLGYTF